MRNEDRIRVRHMFEATQSIERFMAGRNRPDLDADEMLRFAVVHAIEVLGEAANKVSDETRAIESSIPWNAIISMRNRLIHEYYDIDLVGPGARHNALTGSQGGRGRARTPRRNRAPVESRP